MAASRAEVQMWFQEGTRQQASHMVVICDTYDYEDYPAYITASNPEEAEAAAERKNGNMQKVMEVYNLSKDMQDQLNRRRCFEY